MVKLKVEDSRRYISIKSNRDESALYEEFDKRVPREIRGLYVVDALRFKAVFEAKKINGRSRRFSLKFPNECTLGLDNDAEELKSACRQWIGIPRRTMPDLLSFLIQNCLHDQRRPSK